MVIQIGGWLHSLRLQANKLDSRGYKMSANSTRLSAASGIISAVAEKAETRAEMMVTEGGLSYDLVHVTYQANVFDG